jgi:hypothetical protein
VNSQKIRPAAVYEITEFGQRVSPDVLDDQAMDKPQ